MGERGRICPHIDEQSEINAERSKAKAPADKMTAGAKGLYSPGPLQAFSCAAVKWP
jgi:hypothetical protein